MPRPTLATEPAPADLQAERHERAVLACVCACTVLVVGFVAAINLAVPRLAASALHPSSTELLWVVDSYVVLFACLVVPAGALGDRVGRKGVLLAGLAGLAVGAAVCAAAGDVAVLLVGRAVTGIGAACVLPNALAVLVHATEPARRPRAVATWAGMSGIGGLVGNVAGGAILTAGSWRWLFACVTPVALACTVWVAAATRPSSRQARSLDPLGAGLLTGATLAVLLGIVQSPADGWGSATVVGALAVGGVLLAAWVVVELRSAEPMLDPRLLARPGVRAACLGMLVVFFGMFALFFLNASALQYLRGFTVLQAGLGIVPMSVPLVLGTRFVPGLVARVGERVVLAGAFAAVGGGLLGLAGTVRAGYPAYAVFLVVVGVGVTLALPTLTAAITAALPRAQAGVAGGLQATTRELGSALGVAVIGTLATARFVHLLAGVAPRVGGGTVAATLAGAPGRRAEVLHAYASGVGGALAVVGVVVLVAGALVLAESAVAARRAERARGLAGS
jgi:MFS family permease